MTQRTTSLLLANCTFTGNYDGGYAGAIKLDGTALDVTDCTFANHSPELNHASSGTVFLTNSISTHWPPAPSSEGCNLIG